MNYVISEITDRGNNAEVRKKKDGALTVYYKNSPLVQNAMQEVEAYFADKELTNQSKTKKESVLQALRERQARKKEQGQSAERESSKSHKRGEMSL